MSMNFHRPQWGTLHDVANNLFAFLARRRCRQVSDKAKVVASHPLIERIVCPIFAWQHLCHMRFRPPLVIYGALLTLCKDRRACIIMARLKYAGQRLRAIARLVRLDRGARGLIRTGDLFSVFFLFCVFVVGSLISPAHS